MLLERPLRKTDKNDELFVFVTIKLLYVQNRIAYKFDVGIVVKMFHFGDVASFTYLDNVAVSGYIWR